MDLNQKTLVSQEYCTGVVDCRCTNLQTIWLELVYYYLYYWLLEKSWRGSTEGRKLILLFIVWSMNLMCKKKAFLL